jgi:Calcineurin-like phosphoesterase
LNSSRPLVIGVLTLKLQWTLAKASGSFWGVLLSMVLLGMLEGCSDGQGDLNPSPLPSPLSAKLSLGTLNAHAAIPPTPTPTSTSTSTFSLAQSSPASSSSPLLERISSGPNATPSVEPQALMNWAEMAYPYLFPTHAVDISLPPYVYRYYASTGNYLGVSGAEVYVMGPVSAGKLLDVGSLNSFFCAVYPSNCRQGSPLPVIDYAAPGDSNALPLQASLLLGAISEQSVELSVISGSDAARYYVQYGTQSARYAQQTPVIPSYPHQPANVTLTQLQPNSTYFYQVVQTDGAGVKHLSSEQSFHTARPTGQAFTFTLQADSHLDENSDINQYALTLANVAQDRPDFHIDLGDTFMTEKYSLPLNASAVRASDAAGVNKRYLYERNNYGLITGSVPLFLVNGNHDGELGWLNDGTDQNISIWATQARLNYFLNPKPNAFFSGDSAKSAFTGPRAAWYAWTWGDALFVVLDPFWNTPTSGSTQPWAMTLGTAQYTWLSDTLAKSTAKYKFIFLHNLVGGILSAMRGGVEAAPYYEWGGLDTNGANVFKAKRPDLAMPIHALLVKNQVTAVFHGHDHLYAKQELDGIIYQEVPQPSAVNYTNYKSIASSYHYNTGTLLGSSGHLRVSVSPTGVRAQYIHSWLPKDSNAERINAQVADEWVVGSP